MALVLGVIPVYCEHPPRTNVPVSKWMPEPFYRVLALQSPPLTGSDVFMAQNLLIRSPFVDPELPLSSNYDALSAAAVIAFQTGNGLSVTGVFDNATATVLLALHLDADGYKDDGEPLPPGFSYKVYVPVYRNRAIETTATLFDANLNVLHTFTVRTHGQNDANGNALNQFADSGTTPTGLSTFDLNSPEDDPVHFGPYPINRFVQGLRGNSAIVISDIRDGILLHTGEWPDWNTSMPMPNSHGCVHGHPNDIEMVWQILTNQLHVVVHNNTDGKLPYPYVPQGLVSVELIDP